MSWTDDAPTQRDLYAHDCTMNYMPHIILLKTQDHINQVRGPASNAMESFVMSFDHPLTDCLKVPQ